MSVSFFHCRQEFTDILLAKTICLFSLFLHLYFCVLISLSHCVCECVCACMCVCVCVCLSCSPNLSLCFPFYTYNYFYSFYASIFFHYLLPNSILLFMHLTNVCISVRLLDALSQKSTLLLHVKK